MVLEDIQLPRCVALPFPPDNALSAISEWFAMSMTPIAQDLLRRNSNRPPDSLEFRLYQICKKQLGDPACQEIKDRQKKVAETFEEVQTEVLAAVKNFQNMFKDYNGMIKDNEENYKLYREKTIKEMKKAKEIITIHRSYLRANFSLLHIKDALEEAVATYEDAETFLKHVGKQSYYWESPERIQLRYSALIQMKKDLEEGAKEETQKCEKILTEMLQCQEEAFAKVSSLLLKARHLERVIQDVDDRILREETFLTDIQAANEKAWRDYSLINMTVFDLTRGIIEMNDYDPKLLEGTLWDRLEFIRKEHLYNKEVLRRWGQRSTEVAEMMDSARGEVFMRRRAERLKQEEEKKLKGIREICRKYWRRGLPKKLQAFLRLLHIKRKGFPTPGETFDQLCEMVGEGKDKMKIPQKMRIQN